MADVVGHDHGAHGQEHLAADEHRAADVDERLVADEREIADRERRPRIPMAPPPNRTERPPQMPAPRNARRQRSSRSAPNCVSSPIAARPLADDGGAWAEPDAVLDHDARRDDERCPHRAPRPRRSGPPRRAAPRPSRPTAARGRRPGRASSRKAGSRARPPHPVERGRERDAVGRDSGEDRACRRGAAALRAAMTASTSFSVMNPRLSISARSTPCSSARSSALRVACRSPAAGLRRRLLLHSSRRWTRAPRPTRRRTRSSCRARPRRPPRRAGRSSRRPATRPQRSPSSSRRRRPAVRRSPPLRSSTSHSATSAYSVFASSRVRTISSTTSRPRAP